MSARLLQRLRADWATIRVLWWRDLLRFGRQPSRIVGALGQPIIFWGIIGSGMTSTFVLPAGGDDYLAFFFPGVVMMVVLFASIFSSVSLIEDRHQGFLQAVLAGPGSRVALVLGKCLGSSSIALIQVALFMLLLPLSGIGVTTIAWPLLVAALVLTSLALSALGFAVAWGLDNVQGYHAVQMTLLVPLWVISGAMFPVPPGGGLLAAAMRLNPLAYAVSAVRHAFGGGQAASQVVLAVSPQAALGTVAALATLALALAMWLARSPADVAATPPLSRTDHG